MTVYTIKDNETTKPVRDIEETANLRIGYKKNNEIYIFTKLINDYSKAVSYSFGFISLSTIISRYFEGGQDHPFLYYNHDSRSDSLKEALKEETLYGTVGYSDLIKFLMKE